MSFVKQLHQVGFKSFKHTPFEQNFCINAQNYDFHHIKTTGGKSLTALHSLKPVIALAKGVNITVYDLQSNQSATELLRHELPIQALAFNAQEAESQYSGDLLFSADQSKIFVWTWKNHKCIQEVLLSHIYDDCSRFILQVQKNFMYLIQTGKRGNLISLWHVDAVKKQPVTHLAQETLALESECLQLVTLPTIKAQYTDFFTLEQGCIKVWSYQVTRDCFDLIQRYIIKSELKSFCVELGYLFVLGENGKILVLEAENGDYIHTIADSVLKFTCMTISNDKLLLGTNAGAIHVYSIQQFTPIAVIPQCVMLTNDNQNNYELISVRSVELTLNLRYLLVTYEDGGSVLIDRTIKSEQQAIMCRIESDSAGSNQFNSNMQWYNENFLACCAGNKVDLWQVDDRVKLHHVKSLLIEDSEHLTVVCVYPIRNYLMLVGDNFSMIRLYKHQVLVAKFHLERAYSQAIKSMYMTKDEKIAVVMFESGKVSLYDVDSGFKWLGHLFDEISVNHIVFYEENQHHRSYNDVGYNHQLPNRLLGTAFNMIIMTSQNRLDLQRVQVTNSQISIEHLGEVQIPYHSTISGFQIHPSHQHLLVTAEQGQLYIYSTLNGEIEIVIDIPEGAQGCVIDPSGLYVMIATKETVQMFDIKKATQVTEFNSPFQISEMSFSPNSKYLCVLSGKGNISLWATSTQCIAKIASNANLNKQQNQHKVIFNNGFHSSLIESKLGFGIGRPQSGKKFFVDQQASPLNRQWPIKAVDQRRRSFGRIHSPFIQRKSLSPKRKFGLTAKSLRFDSSLNDRDDHGFQAFDLTGRSNIKKGWIAKEPFDIDAGLVDHFTIKRY